MYKRLREFQGGKVVVTVGVPHKCPMAPLEIMFMLHDYFKERGIRDKVKLHYTYPINRVHSLENVAKWAEPEFDRLGITTRRSSTSRRSTAKKRILQSEEGSECEYDLLIAIPRTAAWK